MNMWYTEPEESKEEEPPILNAEDILDTFIQTTNPAELEQFRTNEDPRTNELIDGLQEIMELDEWGYFEEDGDGVEWLTNLMGDYP